MAMSISLPGVTAEAPCRWTCIPGRPPWGEGRWQQLSGSPWGQPADGYGGKLRALFLLTRWRPCHDARYLVSFSFPYQQITVRCRAFADSPAAPYAPQWWLSLGRGFAKDRVSLWAVGSEQGRFVCRVINSFQQELEAPKPSRQQG